ncbi:MAG: glutathione S-transferase family protein [Deltaproteobacteria bacterium]|nr:glutathione S-transferase family protein [Deltaproteobacteria bacterium]
MKLYHFPPSTNSLKVRIALLEKGLEFESVVIDLTKREQKAPDYLKIHPFGQVPALDDDGFVVYDSTVINEYLEDEYPHPPLLPPDSENRALARLMEDYRDNHVNPHFVTLIHEHRKPEEERDVALIRDAHGNIGSAFTVLERQLQGREYLAGPFSLADIAFMPNIALLERFDVPLDPDFKNVAGWIERLRTRASYAATQN